MKKKKHLLKNDKGNLIVLCTQCHDKIHNKEIKICTLVKSTNGVIPVIEL